MSFRDLRNARASRQSNKSFVVPHINDVQAWRTTVEPPQDPTDVQHLVSDEQLVWTVKDEDGGEKREEDEEMDQDEIQRLIKEDNERERAQESTPVPQLEPSEAAADVDIKEAKTTAMLPKTSANDVPSSNALTTPNEVATSSVRSSVEGPEYSTSATNSAFSSSWYTEMPSTIVIKRSKNRGRGLWTKDSIKAGTTIFTTKPRAYVLSRSRLDSFCSACAGPRPITGLKKCGKCKVVHYCGPACQNADWMEHKSECEALRRWAAVAPSSSAPAMASASSETQDESDDDGDRKNEVDKGAEEFTAIPPEAIRCLARIMWKRKKMGSSSMWWKEINEMQSHHDNLAQSMVDAHVHLAHGIVRYMGLENARDLAKFEVRGVGELVDLISKFTSNSFTLATPSLTPIGVAVSPLPALINHSCNPNVAVVFPRSSSRQEEPLIHVVAIQDMQPNTELFTSYVDITLPRSQRQRDLKETYNFTCECEVCMHVPSPDVKDVQPMPEPEDWRERIWCPKGCGGTCPLPLTDDDATKCANCGAQLEGVSKVVDAVRVGQDALNKATSLQFSDPEQAEKLTRGVISLLAKAGLPPSSHPLLALYRLQQGLFISFLSALEMPSKELLDETIRAAAKAAAGLESILRPGHPVRALALAELGKLLAVDEPASDSAEEESSFPPSGLARLDLAIQALKQAHAELQIAFGKDVDGGAVGREVREMLVNLEKELGVWNNRIGQTLKDALAQQKGSVTKLTP